ncbi:hypothetical protein GPECTOR_16g564 [Gonium pectorale]|uniref:Uncharacterized protein n=1 Tax=Gonium pectorale TaxID=33097 RepID=A0A150GKS0_GONPE|nr:hypothetical protein GPECTOR_16g564 [Gonium pectorale]|eukprot:KXZ50391.1 hypothetical protein GPECTOR_16g564 [Gonium pectorale]
MELGAELLFELEDADVSLSLIDSHIDASEASLELLALRVDQAVGRQPSELARELQRDVLQIYALLPVLEPESMLVVLAAQLRGRGYDVRIRVALGGGNECFRSLRHEFLVVRGTGEYEGMELIVEPALRAQFAIPHPSPAYMAALSRVPDVFVGAAFRLVPVVQTLCALMAASFLEQGLTLPPWRREAAMLSKWLPNPCRMVDVKCGAPGWTIASAASGGAATGDAAALAAAVGEALAAAIRSQVAAEAAAEGLPATASVVAGTCGGAAAPQCIWAAAAATSVPAAPQLAVTGFEPRSPLPIAATVGAHFPTPIALAVATAAATAEASAEAKRSELPEAHSHASSFDCGSPMSADDGASTSDLLSAVSGASGGSPPSAVAVTNKSLLLELGLGLGHKNCADLLEVVIADDVDDFEFNIDNGGSVDGGAAAATAANGRGAPQHRPTCTGMLEGRSAAGGGTGLLKARMMLKSLAAKLPADLITGLGDAGTAASPAARGAKPPACPFRAFETLLAAHPGAPAIHRVRMGWPSERAPVQSPPAAGVVFPELAPSRCGASAEPRNWLPWKLPQ